MIEYICDNQKKKVTSRIEVDIGDITHTVTSRIGADVTHRPRKSFVKPNTS